MVQADVITQQRVFKRGSSSGSPLTTNDSQHTGEDAQKSHRQTSRGQKLDYFILDGATIPQRTFSPCFFGPFPIIPTGPVKESSKSSTTKHQTKRYKYGGCLDQRNLCYEKTAKL